MADNVKIVKYGELEQQFFANSEGTVQTARGHIPAMPEIKQSGGRTFMQAYFGFANGARELCTSMEELFAHTRKKVKDAGAAFRAMDEQMARSVK